MPGDEGHFMLDETNITDWKQAQRMPVLFKFFEERSTAELLMDLHWLVQYVIFRQHQDGAQQSHRIEGLKQQILDQQRRAEVAEMELNKRKR